jgi:hypothetical protein
MPHAVRYHEALLPCELDSSILQVDQEAALDDIEELIFVGVVVPVILALDDAQADNGIVDPAQGLIEPARVHASAIACTSISSSGENWTLSRVSYGYAAASVMNHSDQTGWGISRSSDVPYLALFTAE